MYVEVNKSPPLVAGLEYAASSYPGDGVYLVQIGTISYLMIVCSNCVYAAVGAGKLVQEGDGPLKVEHLETPFITEPMMTERSMLKALAITMKPELALELTKD